MRQQETEGAGDCFAATLWLFSSEAVAFLFACPPSLFGTDHSFVDPSVRPFSFVRIRTTAKKEFAFAFLD
jgi:hypothetical protein